MFSLLLLAALCASCLAAPVPESLMLYSYSNAVGTGGGTSFSTEAQGRITAVRVWEISSSYITGIQICYDNIWSGIVGRKIGPAHELSLHDEEGIIQVSGKYHINYIYQLIFVTSKGRSLIVGQPVQRSFNMYPINPKAELKLLSGRYNTNGIVSLGAHWQVVYVDTDTIAAVDHAGKQEIA